ncbi:4'-phosphopantetheinyl transferase family protein [Achromobacter pulmonis]|uniref:4'-phosphopantetheinyl transferase family protein n=1 Tax=Achromobacter pulmonis TaxID=1389932 RepID=UPI003C711CB1
MTEPSSNFDVTVVLGAQRCARDGQAARTKLGKPYQSGLAGFGVSDSCGIQARLYANRKYVGIDIEHLDRPDMAVRQQRLSAWLARRDRVTVDFLAGWVAREACAKSVGLGLLHALPRLSITWKRPLEQPGQEEIGLTFSRWRFVARCERVGRVLLCVCYRAEYGKPRIALLRP